MPVNQQQDDERLKSNTVLCRLRAFIAVMPPSMQHIPGVKLIIEAADELTRLLRGDFTDDEVQGLCHNFNDDDVARFKAGCDEYQRKLFGPKS